MFGFRFRPSAQKRKHVMGLLRAAGYLSALSVVLLGVQIRSARAEIQDGTVQLGRKMSDLANGFDQETNKITLNGQVLYIGSTLSTDTPKQILERYKAYCEDNSAQPPGSWPAVKPGAAGAPDEKNALSGGILRGGDDREGTITCFTKTASTKTGFGEAMKSLAETGNLGAVGAARYVYAKMTPNGKTHVLTAWTDDTFNINELMGVEEGKDVPGAEFAGIPRPETSQRIMAARVEGSPFGMNVYRSKDAPEKIAKFYDDELVFKGWHAIDPGLEERKGHEDGPQVGRLYEKDGVVVTVASKQQDEKDGTFTAVGLAGHPERSGKPDFSGGGATGAPPLTK